MNEPTSNGTCDPRCDGCRHWKRLGAGERYGYCRRYPPQLMSANGHTDFPRTHDDTACGEHAPLPPGAEPAVKEKKAAPVPAYMQPRAVTLPVTENPPAPAHRPPPPAAPQKRR